MPIIPDLIAQWRNKQINGLGLMRGLVGYEAWVVPISEAAAVRALAHNDGPSLQLSTDPAGKVSLLLFSDVDALHRYRQSASAQGEQHFLTLRGGGLFIGPFENVNRIHIDPLSPYDIFYDTEQFPRLFEMARAIALEQALTSLRQGTAPDGIAVKVREFDEYRIAIAQHESGPSLLMAPDSKGRSLAAVFTAQDAFDAYVPTAKKQSGGSEVKETKLGGPALFKLLLSMKLDGIVFNCEGPVRPIAFALGLASIILQA